MTINEKEIEKYGNGAEEFDKDELGLERPLKIEFVEDETDDETERAFKSVMKNAFMERLADCTFYLFPLHIDASFILDEEERGEICNHFAEQIGVRNFVIRYGAEIRSALKLKEEFARRTEEKINIIYVDMVENKSVMFDERQRSLFWNAINETEDETDTLVILLKIIEDTEGEAGKIKDNHIEQVISSAQNTDVVLYVLYTKNVQLKEAAERDIAAKCAEDLGARSFVIRSGMEVQTPKTLLEELEALDGLEQSGTAVYALILIDVDTRELTRFSMDDKHRFIELLKDYQGMETTGEIARRILRELDGE